MTLAKFKSHRNQPRLRATQPSNLQWSRPKEDRYKMNFDGAVFAESNKAWIE